MSDPQFTIEDIHKIRYENYKKTKHLSPNDLIEITNKRAEKVIKRLEEIKKEKNKLV